jgi:hypothetical protein
MHLPRRLPRRFVSAWLLTLMVVSCLFARPLHEALDVWQATHRLPAAGVGRDSLPPVAVAAQPQDERTGDLGSTPDDASDNGSSEEGGQPATCAWCLMLAHAQAPATVPALLLQHAEASSPPIEPPQGLPAGRCALAAEPRGPPQA